MCGGCVCLCAAAVWAHPSAVWQAAQAGGIHGPVQEGGHLQGQPGWVWQLAGNAAAAGGGVPGGHAPRLPLLGHSAGEHCSEHCISTVGSLGLQLPSSLVAQGSYRPALTALWSDSPVLWWPRTDKPALTTLWSDRQPSSDNLLVWQPCSLMTQDWQPVAWQSCAYHPVSDSPIYCNSSLITDWYSHWPGLPGHMHIHMHARTHTHMHAHTHTQTVLSSIIVDSPFKW